MNQNVLIPVIRKLYWYSTVVLGAICIVYYFCAPYIFQIFLPQYQDADGISIVLMFGFGFIPYYMVWQIFSAKKNVPVLYYISIGEPIMVVVLYLVLIPFYGIWGIAVALVSKTLVMNALAIWYLYRKRDVYENNI